MAATRGQRGSMSAFVILQLSRVRTNLSSLVALLSPRLVPRLNAACVPMDDGCVNVVAFQIEIALQLVIDRKDVADWKQPTRSPEPLSQPTC